MKPVDEPIISSTDEQPELEWFDCCFCEGEFGLGQTKDGDSVVAHDLPVCLKYVSTCADEFLNALVAARAKS